jgi:hypothetical protein
MDYSKYKNTKPFPSRDMSKEDREAMRKEYDIEDSRIYNQFWDDISEEYGISQDHPKWSTLMRMAWEHGHSAGYGEVDYWVNELLELIDY